VDTARKDFSCDNAPEGRLDETNSAARAIVVAAHELAVSADGSFGLALAFEVTARAFVVAALVNVVTAHASMDAARA